MDTFKHACSPLQILRGATAFSTVMFLVISMLALLRAPYQQLAMYLYLFFGLSLGLAGLLTFLKIKKNQAKNLEQDVSQWKIPALWLAGLLVLLATLLGLYIDQMYDIPLRSYKDTRAVRIGEVSNSTIAILVRDPLATVAQLSIDTLPPVKLPIDPDADYTVVLRYENLSPDTLYEVQVVTDAPIPLPRFVNGLVTKEKPVLKLKTTSNSPNTNIRFAFGSCTLPFPYRNAMEGYKYIYEANPDFFVHLGDFVYADVPYVVGDNLENYRRLYRRNFLDPYYMTLAQKIPSFHIWDDHEVIDNWESKETAPYGNAMRAYSEYVHRVSAPSDASNRWYFNTSSNGNLLAMFYTNGRAYRYAGTNLVPEELTKPGLPLEPVDATYLGQTQFDSLKAWLLDSHQRGVQWKIIVSSVPFTLGYRDRDTWFGFRRERAQLMKWIKDNNIKNVHVISGDRHEVGIFRVDESANLPFPMYDLSVSPIHAFYDDVDTMEDPQGNEFRMAGARSFVGIMDVTSQNLRLNVLRYGESVYNLTIPRIV